MSSLNFTFYSDFPVLVKKKGIEYAAKYATEQGYSSVEFLDMAGMDGYTPTIKSLGEAIDAKKVLDKYGLSVACFSVGVNLIKDGPTAALNTNAVDDLKYYARLAAIFGSPFFHHTLVFPLSILPDAPSYDEVLHTVLDAAGEVADFCESLGLTCLYEPQGMYFNGIYGYGRIYRELKKNHKNVGFCADVGNSLFVDEMPYELLKEFSADAKHVHLKNYQINATSDCKLRSRNGISLAPTSLRSGSIDIAACIELIRSAGYKGALALEDSYSPDETRDAMNYIKELFDQSL